MWGRRGLEQTRQFKVASGRHGLGDYLTEVWTRALRLVWDLVLYFGAVVLGLPQWEALEDMALKKMFNLRNNSTRGLSKPQAMWALGG